MRELFGLPVTTLAVVLGGLVILALAVVGALAFRNRVLFKLGVRNVSRRRGRSAIIVGGLMLGTMIIGSALGFGDIMSSTVRTSVITSLGQTDEKVSARSTDAPDIASIGQSTGARYLTAEEAARVLARARSLPAVDAAAPGISESVAVQDASSRATEPQMTLFATDPASMTGFGQMRSASGSVVSLADLPVGEAFVNAQAVEDLNAGPGDRLTVFVAGRPHPLTVRGVVQYDGTGTDGAALLMGLGQAQRLLGVGTKVQHVLVSNDGTQVTGAQRTDEVSKGLQHTADQLGLEVKRSKQDGLERADAQGETFMSLFSTFGTFTISAGILLIFLVFVMLAAERRGEMGTARAIGTQRRHLIQMFVFEGTAYDILAAVVGAVLGLALAMAMVRLIAGALTGSGVVTIRYSLTWTSFVVAFSLGVLLTLLVVWIAAWRVSRLNIVAAVRNLPQPPRRLRRRSQGFFLALSLVLGCALLALAFQSESGLVLLVAGTILISTVVPLTRLLGASDRLAYTVCGVGVLVWNLLPFSVYEKLVPGLRMDFSVFVLVGLLLVAGATWVVVYNLHAVLGALMWVFGRSRRAAPVVSTAIAQPMRSRFKTGSTIALFTLVVFTMVVGASTSTSFMATMTDQKTFGGGYDITAQTSPLSPVRDMPTALRAAPGLHASDVVSVSGQSYVPVQARQVGAADSAGYVVRGLDDSFLHHTTYGFATRANGYDSDRAVWTALAADPHLAVIDGLSVPRRVRWGTGAISDFQLSGFYLEDKHFAPVPVDVRDTQSGKTVRLKVIGVLSDSVPPAMVGLATSQQALATFGPVAAPTVWYFDVRRGVDPVRTAQHLEAAFLGNGMQAEALSEVQRDAFSQSMTFTWLILGFLALGLVIGVAALGVISARAVVERRQQIGVLRAIGFQARMVQTSFLLESLFVTLIGVVMGTALGLLVAWNVVADSARRPGMDNLTLQPPWVALAGILSVVVLAAVATTWLPSRQASRTYPARALRYE
jgi:putative ABC transport system permease protein